MWQEQATEQTLRKKAVRITAQVTLPATPRRTARRR